MDDILGITKCGLKSVSLNSFLNASIELKKLRFHTPNKEGKTKCHVMHVGRNSKFCPQLKVHGTPMQRVTEDM